MSAGRRSVRCGLGWHTAGPWERDEGMEPAVSFQRCRRCGKALASDPPVREVFYHQFTSYYDAALRSGNPSSTCRPIQVGPGYAGMCPGHVIGLDGREIASCAPQVRQQIAQARNESRARVGEGEGR